MVTKKPRVYITLEPEIVSLLSLIAKKEKRSISSLAKELIHQALEKREDSELSALAKKKDSKNEKTISHEDAWK